jgi:hypothetical protein
MEINTLDYIKAIEQIENGEIFEIIFSINNYTHYRLCKLYRETDVIKNGNELNRICIDPVPDKTESVCFLSKFSLGKGKKYTLRQIWDRITILDIIRKT